MSPKLRANVNPRLLIALLVVLLAIIVPLAACGGGGDATESETTEIDPVLPAEGDTSAIDDTFDDTTAEDPAETPGETPPASTDGGKVVQIKVAGPSLELGASGKRVKQLQQALIAMKLLDEGSADGDFGGKTKTAVQAFQLAKGLKADGVAGKQTIRQINRAVKRGETFDSGSGTEDAGTPDAESVDTSTDEATSDLLEPAPDQATEPILTETE